ncbi:MAG: copper amine oxidase N-terminal domain-containing protein, partial [Clostridia bacterium]|nr:copper amine oxidase N-terminal domain-containing protein [Clostridia bacterium]
GVIGAAGQPGTEEDPLVTKSWVDRYLDREFALVQDVLSSLDAQLLSLDNKLERISSFPIILTIGQAHAKVGTRECTLEAPPFITAGRTYLPLRFVGEAFGTQFHWDGVAKKITYQTSQGMVELVIGANTAKIGTETVQLDAPAQIKNGRTVVPLRFVGESLGASVTWHNETKTVEIR